MVLHTLQSLKAAQGSKDQLLLLRLLCSVHEPDMVSRIVNHTMMSLMMK